MGACGESRHEHDDRTNPSSEKGTQMSQPYVDENCVSDEESNGGNIAADDSMHDVEKIQRDSDAELSENVGLQDDLEEDQEPGNDTGECSNELDNGPMTYVGKHETPPNPVEASLVPRQNSSASNDERKISASESKKKIKLFEKNIIVVNGTTYCVTKGKEEKYGFQRMR